MKLMMRLTLVGGGCLWGVIDSEHHFVGLIGTRLCPAFHRFSVAIARAVNEDGSGRGTAINPSVWSAGAVPKEKKAKVVVKDYYSRRNPFERFRGFWK